MKLIIIDPNTDEYPKREDMQAEEWYTFDPRLKLDGFLLDEDGGLALADRCGNYIYPPEGRFQVAVLIGENKHFG